MRTQRLVTLVLFLITAACTPQPTEGEGETREGEGEEGEGEEGEGEEGEGEEGDIFDLLDDRFAFVEEIEAQNPGTRAFNLYLEQPVDHDDPDGETFLQWAVLVHTDATAPMILNHTGYSLFPEYTQLPEELTSLLSANQVQVEHRFFGISVPDAFDAADWEQLTVRNAAADAHRFVEVLKPIYGARWLETGHSKGGMTSVFHASLFPNDVDGVVAYVAPISFAINDERGRAFFDTIGDPGCRETVQAQQRAAAAQRDELLAIMRDARPDVDVAVHESNLAATIGSFEWGFWQFYADCSLLGEFALAGPTAEETAELLGLRFLITDDLSFLPYSYQVLNELGQPNQLSPHLDDVFGDVNVDPLSPYGAVPFARAVPYDGGAQMTAIAEHVASHDRFLFVYGGYDPWSQVPFTVGTADSHRFVAPAANHAALMIDLDVADRTVAFDAVSRWAGVTDAAFSVGSVDVDAWRARMADRRAWLASRVGLRP
jgi:hypothetical protein